MATWRPTWVQGVGAAALVAGFFAWRWRDVEVFSVFLGLSCVVSAAGLQVRPVRFGALAAGASAGVGLLAALSSSRHSELLFALQLAAPPAVFASRRAREGALSRGPRLAVTSAAIGAALPFLLLFGLFGLMGAPPSLWAPAYTTALVLGGVAAVGLVAGRTWALPAILLGGVALALFAPPAPWSNGGCMSWSHPADSPLRWAAVGLLGVGLAPWIGPLVRAVQRG